MGWYANKKVFVVGGSKGIGREVAVQLDDVQMGQALEQRRGQCATPRADLEHAVARRRSDRLDDAPDHCAIDQEVLPEALARPGKAHVRAGAAACASSSASRAAASRLPGSARRLPARSSAVP